MSLTNLVAGPQDTQALQAERGPLSEQSLADLSATLSRLTDELKYRAEAIALQVSPALVPYVTQDQAVLYSHFGPAIEVYDEIKKRLDEMTDKEVVQALQDVKTPYMDISLIQLATRLRTTAGIPASPAYRMKKILAFKMPFPTQDSRYVIVLADEEAIETDMGRDQTSRDVRHYAMHINRLLGDTHTSIADEATLCEMNMCVPIRYFSLASKRLHNSNR